MEGGPNSPAKTVAPSKRPRQRRDWTYTETDLSSVGTLATKLLIPWESLQVKQRKQIKADGKTVREISIGN